MIRHVLRASILLASVLVPVFAADPSPSPDDLIDKGHYKQARALLEKRLAANANDADAMAQMALVKLEFHEVDPAIQLAEKAVALKNDAQTHAALADCYGTKADGDVGMFEGLKLVRAFRREVDASIALDPKNHRVLRSLMQFYLSAPGFAGGSKSKANEVADKIAAIDAALGFMAKSEIAMHEKQFDQALSFNQKAVDADPQSYDALVRTAAMYANEKWRDLGKAEQYAQKAIHLDPSRAIGYGVLGQVRVLQEKWNDLDQLLAQAEKAVPDDYTYYFRAGRVLLAGGKDNPRAERYFRKYLSQEPEGGTPTLAAGHWQLGLALEKLDRKQDAVAELQTAVKMDPQLKAAKNDLKRLQS
jgi:tetratricopeptide (TPR) repeat protein